MWRQLFVHKTRHSHTKAKRNHLLLAQLLKRAIFSKNRSTSLYVQQIRRGTTEQTLAASVPPTVQKGMVEVSLRAPSGLALSRLLDDLD